MANSQLQGNSYRIPENIINSIKAKLYTNPSGDGVKRGKFIVKNGNCTYEQLKRIKNFFDTFDPNVHSKDEYDLSGGLAMKDFIDKKLAAERDKTETSTDIRRPIKAGMDNHTLKSQTGMVDLMKMGEGVNEGAVDGGKLNRNAIIIIFDSEMRILLLKRSSYPDQWMPNRWSLAGGSVEDGEDPMEAAKRELKEETGIEVQSLIEKFVLQRNGDNVEHMYITKLPEGFNNDSVTLDKENDGYAWVTYNELKEMSKDSLVPNLLDYVRVAIENYD